MNDDFGASSSNDSSSYSSGDDGPQVVIADSAQPSQGAWFDNQPARAPSFSPFRSVAGALSLGLLGALVWAGITYATDYHLGIIAIAIGWLAGKGAIWGGRGKPAQVIGAVAAAASYFIGQFVLVLALAAGDGPAEEPIIPDPQQEIAAEAEGASPTEEADPAGEGSDVPQVQPEQQPQPEQPPQPEEPPISIWMAVGLVFVAIIGNTFTSIDVIFLGIAVWEGWVLPRRA